MRVDADQWEPPILNQSLEFSSDFVFAFGFRLKYIHKINNLLWDNKSICGAHVFNSTDVKFPSRMKPI